MARPDSVVEGGDLNPGPTLVSIETILERCDRTAALGLTRPLLRGEIRSSNGEMAGSISEPRARVEAFIGDYAARWAKYAEEDKTDYSPWHQTLCLELTAAHWREGHFREIKEKEPSHVPGLEILETVDVEGNRGTILTLLTRTVENMFFGGSSEQTLYHEYTLTKQDDDWRIVDLVTYREHPDAAVVDHETRDTNVDATSANAETLPAEDADRLADLFDTTKSFGDLGETVVRGVGVLEIDSGIVGVGDFMFFVHSDAPRARRIAPGAFNADIAVLGGRVSALRLQRPDSNIASWATAETTYGSVSVGVDAGNVAVFDYMTFANLSLRAHARIVRSHVTDNDGATAKLAKLGSKIDCVVTASGHGDGVYPVYWGLGADGEPVALVVDFLVIESA